MKVVHLSVECFPVAKVGGLADVVGALPKYQRQLGLDASVIMPFYDRPFVKEHCFVSVATGEFYHGSELLQYEVLEERDRVLGFPLFLIRIPGILDRPEVYMYPDEAEQWIAFQHAILHYLSTRNIVPDVVHCHDHHVGLMPFLLQYTVDYRNLSAIKTVVTIHNAQYQGWMNWDKAVLLPRFDTWKWGLLDWDGLINPLAAAVKCCHVYTTVSQGYLDELFTEANGLQNLFVHERNKAFGIINGIDSDYWNPENDTLIDKNYKPSSVLSGKRANKKVLCKDYGLDANRPLLAYIGRFAIEKGADMLPDIIEELFSGTDFSANIFVLGSGDERIRLRLEVCLGKYQDRLAAFFGYDERLSHRVYAASDLLLMPSRVEPCGLNQMYAMKYGAIPVVRAVGGLKDTVIDIDDDGYGFLFHSEGVHEIASTVKRAERVLENRAELARLRKTVMSLDFSWESSANKYQKLYHQL